MRNLSYKKNKTSGRILGRWKKATYDPQNSVIIRYIGELEGYQSSAADHDNLHFTFSCYEVPNLGKRP